jgi:hypothetical protein
MGMVDTVSVELMRKAILKVYPGEKWVHKVSNMSDRQIIAIYYKFLNENKLIK